MEGKKEKMMSKNTKLFLMVLVLVVLVAAFAAIAYTGHTALAGGMSLNGFCVGSSAGSCGVG